MEFVDPPLTVLVVEDNPNDAMLIERHLGNARTAFLPDEVEVYHERRLEDGVDRADDVAVDLLLLDLGLPESDGAETFARVRDRLPEVPVVVLTNLDDDRTAVDLLQRGAQDYLNKRNLSEEQLVKSVRYALERQAQKRKLRTTTEQLEVLNRILRHDVRNDMSVVLGWADLLEGHTDETGQEYVQRILDAGAHVTELTETARDYADTVTGGGDLETHPVSLRETLRHEVDLQREAFPDAEFVVDGEIPDLDVAANELLRSVFKNILNNAVRHNKGSDPVVEVRCDVDPDAVTVSIADNGPGVPDGQKASIFGEGEKGLESTGTGIGLYLVKTLIDQYEGSVAVADNEPTGSVFSVQLPRAD